MQTMLRVWGIKAYLLQTPFIKLALFWLFMKNKTYVSVKANLRTKHPVIIVSMGFEIYAEFSHSVGNLTVIIFACICLFILYVFLSFCFSNIC
jgi:hypothetical protein